MAVVALTMYRRMHCPAYCTPPSAGRSCRPPPLPPRLPRRLGRRRLRRPLCPRPCRRPRRHPCSDTAQVSWSDGGNNSTDKSIVVYSPHHTTCKGQVSVIFTPCIKIIMYLNVYFRSLFFDASDRRPDQTLSLPTRPLPRLLPTTTRPPSPASAPPRSAR